VGKTRTVLKAGAAAAAAIAMAAPALAQGANGNVVLFGVVDEYLASIHPQGGGSVTRLDSSGLLASRWGVHGREDLGGGLAANFWLEAGLNANDGSRADGNRAFNRQSWVGLSGGWGELRLGRQNTPQFYMNGKFDAFNGATYASGWNNVTGAAPRVDDAIGYFSPAFGAVKAQLLVARGALAGAPIAPQVAGNQNVHAALEYEVPAAYVGLNYESVDSTAVAYTTKRTGLGASYAITPRWRVFGAWGHETRSDDSLKQNLYSISAAWQATPAGVLAFGWFRLADKLSGTGHGNADQASVQYRYALSRRTTIYSALARIKQHGLRNNLSLGGAAVVEAGARPTSPVPGGSVSGMQVGITHTF
jgi:predicted porin